MTPYKRLVNRTLPGRQRHSGQHGGQDALDLLRVPAAVGNEVVNIEHAVLFFWARLRGLSLWFEVLLCSGLLSAHSGMWYRVLVVGGVSVARWVKHWLISVESERACSA